MQSIALASVVALGFSAAAAQANPCERPQEFLRSADAALTRAALVRPYVLRGMPVVAVHERGGRRWLELAVDSAATARRSLGLAAEGVPPPQVLQDESRVLLACDGGGATAQADGSARQPLW